MQEYQKLALDSPIFQKGALGVVLAGIAGAFFAGYASDWLFQSRRTPVAFIGYALIIFSLTTIWLANDVTLVIVAFISNSLGVGIKCPYTCKIRKQ